MHRICTKKNPFGPDDTIPADIRLKRLEKPRILRHWGLSWGAIYILANQRGPPRNLERDPDEPRELQRVPNLTFI